MSLILEALRKSEAQRRRATVPDVHAELAPPPTTRSRHRVVRGAGIALIALLSLALWINRAAMVPATPAIRPVTSGAAVAPVTVQVPALPLVRHLSPPPAPPARIESSMAATAPTRAPAPARSPASVHATTIASPDAARTAAIAAPPMATSTTSARPPPAVTAPAMSAMSSPSATLSLADLSVDERKALPPLKMSMHLWNDDPAQRLVIIDGNRLHEGDRIGDAVLTAIVADGVLLDWNGRRLKLPIR
jgi:general secretion pathway protein B